MSYLVTLHSCGGSMGEAIPAAETVVVATEAEAEAIVDWVDKHPINGKYGEIWALHYEIGEPTDVAGGIETLEESWVFED